LQKAFLNTKKYSPIVIMAEKGKGVVIEAVENDPYLLKVDKEILTALCRCGASKNKPYCDGTHAKIGFKASKATVKVV
jgi:CDGSH-type Zn-finger protein